MANRLANETSTYLLQHKDNPIDWYPWGDEAFERARSEDKPIFLSVGYAACHWCHVMERESFEDAETAEILNKSFVSIKVDREERPDVDSIYMRAVQGMTGQSGWPMSVFLTPAGEPFYAGTYFPPQRHGNLPSFRNVLESVREAYHERRGEVAGTARQVRRFLEGQNQPRAGAVDLTPEALNSAYRTLAGQFDADHGGFAGSPKFPQPLVHEFLLHYWHRTGELRAVAMAEISANRIARGGIYDQIGGGFHRYTIDAAWGIPHFEKMLYDNALLTLLFLHLYQATGKQIFRNVVETTLAYVEREMLDGSGAFYSSQDADSEGEEGKFFVWEAAEVDRLLGELAPIARLYFGITDGGNFEGKNVLSVPLAEEEVAVRLSMPVEELRQSVEEARRRLFEARERRPRPDRDEKVVTSWNALMLKSFAEAGAVLANERYVQIADRNADFILDSLRQGERLFRTWRHVDGAGQARVGGYLEDYAALVDGLLTLYEATFDTRRLAQATATARSLIDLFWDTEQEAFFDTARDQEQLLVRPRNIFDNAHPCGGSLAAMALLRLTEFTGDMEYRGYAEKSLRAVYTAAGTAPAALAHWLAALDFCLSEVKQVAIIGGRNDPATLALLEVTHNRYLPNRAIVFAEEPPAEPPTPLLEGKLPIAGLPTAFFCHGYRCDMPSTEPEDLAGQITGWTRTY